MESIGSPLEVRKREVMEELRNPQEKALEKIGNFLDKLYGEGIPEKVKERMAMLRDEEGIVISDKEFAEKLKERRLLGLRAKMTRGFYDSRDDKIYLRKDAHLNEIIHESLHFISAGELRGEARETGFLKHQLDEQGAIIANENGMLNEAMTCLMTMAIEEKLEIDVFTFSGASRQQVKKTRMARSYRNAQRNLLDMFSSNELAVVEMFPKAIQYYLEGNFEGFDTMVKGKLGSKTTKECYERIEKPDNVEKKLVNYWFKRHTEEIKTRQGTDEGLKKKLNNLVVAMEKGSKGGVEYVFPGNVTWRGLINIMGMVGVRPEMRINLALYDLWENERFRKEYLNSYQMMAYVAWQAIRLDKTREGDSCTDNEFFKNQEMRKFLMSLGTKNLNAIEKMAGKMLGVKLSDEDRRVILEGSRV